MYFDRFDIVEAHYWFCADYHEGQWSDKYARLCRIGDYYTPGPLHKGYGSLSENAREIYDNLTEQEGRRCR